MPRSKNFPDSTLLELATFQFLQHGYLGTSMRDLEQVLGIKAPAIYNRFGSKQALFEQVMDYYLTYIIAGRITRYLQHEKPLQGLREFFDSIYNSTGNHPPAICLLVSTPIETDTSVPSIQALIKTGNARLINGFKNNLQHAQQLKLLSASANTQQLAESLLLCLQGLLVIKKLEPPSVLAQKVDVIFSLLPIME